VDLCLADREFIQAEAAPAGANRTRHLHAALELYRKAASAANDSATRIKALDAATRTLDARHLNDPGALELTLRELIGIAPNDLRFMFRLSRVQEDQGELEGAEDTLLRSSPAATGTRSLQDAGTVLCETRHGHRRPNRTGKGSITHP
jgi:hypothetical protein